MFNQNSVFKAEVLRSSTDSMLIVSRAVIKV